MVRRITGIVFAASLLPLAAGAQAPAPPAAKETPTEAKETPRTYVPGLEQFMNVILIEHNKLWFAARERNWPLAAYELGEIKEIMGDIRSDFQESAARRNARCRYHERDCRSGKGHRGERFKGIHCWL